jgi:hypothetical protein
MSRPAPDLSRPSLRSHLAPFTEGPRAWLVLARNAIPVVGVYWLGWSADVAVFQIWFDGVTALGALLAFQVRAFARSGGKTFEAPPGLPASVMPGVLALGWLLIWLLLGIPYWFTMLFLNLRAFDEGFWALLFRAPGVMIALLLVLVSNTVEESRRGYERMREAEIRLEFNWEFSMHLARVAAMLLVAFVMPPGLILGLALALSYVEIYPMRTLRFLGGDQTLEADNENRSRD